MSDEVIGWFLILLGFIILTAVFLVMHRNRLVMQARATVTGPDEYGSMYVYLRPGERQRGVVKRTHEAKEVTVLLDYDHQGRLYGIELLAVPDRDPRA